MFPLDAGVGSALVAGSIVGVLIAADLLLRSFRRKRRGQGDALRIAAAEGDVVAMKRERQRGAELDAADNIGDTALHLALIYNRREAVSALLDWGASVDVTNLDGLRPREMPAVREVEKLLIDTEQLMRSNGLWRNEREARSAYDLLKCTPVPLLAAAIRRRGLEGDAGENIRLAYIAIKLGIAATEEILMEFLERQANSSLATVYLNCGSSRLSQFAEAWAVRNGYRIQWTGSGLTPRWGAF